MPAEILIPVYLKEPDDAEDPGPHLENVERVLWRCQQWWATNGVYVCHAGFNVLMKDTGIDWTVENPWGAAFNMIVPEYPAGTIILAIAPRWYAPTGYIGWGGKPFALVGKWVWDRLKDAGTPEAIWNDEQCGNVIMHETGHALGLDHDFATPNALMGYSFRGFDSILSQRPNTGLIQSGFGRQGCRLGVDI